MFSLNEKVDLSRLRSACAVRMLRPVILDEKGKLIRRLQERYVICTLPRRYSETKVEQSFNEQLFARVFDYGTLFSAGELPFNILPKNHFHGNYDDFSIGFFGLGRDRVFASAELKNPGADLDAPQFGQQYEGRTPVEQALNTAKRMPTCRWVIVSNLRDLRLYRVIDQVAIAKVDLLAIRSRSHTAALCALFDKSALLGRKAEEAEMETYLEASHLAQPVPEKAGFSRLVFRFTPLVDDPFSLYVTEMRLRDVLKNRSAILGLASSGAIFSPKVSGGWVCCDNSAASPGWKLSMNRYGELQYSAYIPISNNQSVSWSSILGVASSFWAILLEMNAPALRQVSASIGAEFRDVPKVKLIAPQDAVIASSPCDGNSQARDIVVGEFNCTLEDVRNTRAALVFSLCDIAVQFRGSEGGVLLDAGMLSREFR